MTYKVLLCDDEQSVSDEWHQRVRAVVPPQYNILTQPENAAVQSAIKELFAREASARLGISRQRSRCMFDDAEILVLDYDLLYIDRENARHTGESIARLARAFSTAQVVVVVNQFRDAQFDLSLRGHFVSHADLNLDATLLDAPGLWADPPWNDGFRPWHWQTLFRAVDTQAQRAAWVHDQWGERIVDAIGMRDDDIARLTDTAFGFIAPSSPDERQLRQRTFEDFVRQPSNGRHVAGFAEASRSDASRFASARIGKWLERLVLGPQDALIDMPHLIQRFPFLLGGDVTDLEAWNEAIHDGDFPSRLPAECLFEPSDILSRPAVWSHRFENSDFVREHRRTFDFADVPPFVFLEDTSSFAHIDQAKQFRAGHHNAFDRRFAKCLAGFTYAPQRRLAFAG